MLEIERILPAPAPTVFAAFTDPLVLRRWWGPRGFTIPSLRFEPAVGRDYRIQMQPPDGESFYLNGQFREVDPPSRLAYTFGWEPPDPDDIETLVELSFRNSEGATAVALSQGPFKTRDRLDLHRDGWSESFERLDAVLSGA